MPETGTIEREPSDKRARTGHAWSAKDLLHTRLQGVESELKGILAHNSYAIRVDDAMWEPGGEAIMVSDQFFLEWTPFCSALIDVALPGSNFRRMGKIVFLPPNTSLACRWESGRSHSVSCSFGSIMFEPADTLLAGLLEITTEAMLDVADPYLDAAMHRINEEVLEPGLDSDVTMGCLILSLGSALHRTLRKKDGLRLARNAISSRQLATFTDLLRDWEGKLPSVGQLAAHCGLPVADMARSVGQATGLTLRAFIARERVERAKALLRQDAILIKQLSFRCGFANPAAFSAAFRKSAGMTPAEYRACH